MLLYNTICYSTIIVLMCTAVPYSTYVCGSTIQYPVRGDLRGVDWK